MKRYYVNENTKILYKVENNSVTALAFSGIWVPSAYSVADVETMQAFTRISHQKATAIRKAKLARRKS